MGNYYPYGGVIGDISTNENVQKYKLFHYIPREQARSEGPRSHQKEIDNLLARRRAFRRGVELDRTFGLDNYDIHARQYFAMMPSWDRIDPLVEKYYGISPYAYCGGDPVNLGDYDGMGWITATYNQETWYCFDPRIKSQEDINKYCYYGDDINDKNISYLGETSEVIHNNNTFVFFHDDGSYSYFSASSCAANETTEIDEAGLHIGKVYPNGESGEIETNKNLFGVYLGQFNPKDNNQKDSYCIPPIDWLDYAAYCHDKGYDKVGAKGIIGVLFNTKTVDADSNLSKSSAKTSVQCLPRLSHYYLRRTLFASGASILFYDMSINKSLLNKIPHYF